MPENNTHTTTSNQQNCVTILPAPTCTQLSPRAVPVVVVSKHPPAAHSIKKLPPATGRTAGKRSTCPVGLNHHCLKQNKQRSQRMNATPLSKTIPSQSRRGSAEGNLWNLRQQLSAGTLLCKTTSRYEPKTKLQSNRNCTIRFVTRASTYSCIGIAVLLHIMHISRPGYSGYLAPHQSLLRSRSPICMLRQSTQPLRQARHTVKFGWCVPCF